MRFAAFLMLAASTLLAADPGALPAFVSAADVAKLIERAKTERKPDQINFTQRLSTHGSYRATFESRKAGKATNPNIHETDTELVYVVDGAGMLTMGGTLKDEKRTNEFNRSGSGINGGNKRHIAKGDFFIIPEGIAHAFTDVEGTLVIISVHGPKGLDK